MEILTGLANVLSDPSLILAVLAAAMIGILVGAMPGLTASAAIAMLVPLTVFMEPLFALAFLYVIGKSGRYGGSIAAILFNTPGTAASAATRIDGYPLARQGKAGKALKVATLASVIGDTIGELFLIFGVGMIAALALMLGPPELFAIYVAAFVVIGSVIGQSVIKGLASAALGVLLRMVGLDPISAEERFTFGIVELADGIGLVPLMIGIFVLGEVFSQLETKAKQPDIVTDPPSGDDRLTLAECRTCLPHMLRSSLIGSAIGVLPGLGSTVAAFVAYGEGKRRVKNPERWGKGAIEGVAAPEAANNAVSGPSMAPLLTLGIPGSTIGAILIGVFLIHGIQIGPTLFVTSRDLVYSLFAAGLLGIAAYGLIGYFAAARIGRLIRRLPTDLLYPMIFLTAFVAAYASRGSLFDVLIMVLAGFGGWLMQRAGLNTAALVIAFVLAGGAEETFRQSLLLSDHGALIFLERPIALGFLLLGLAALILRTRSLARERQATMSTEADY